MPFGAALSFAMPLIVDMSNCRRAFMRQPMYGCSMSRRPERERDEQQGGEQDPKASHSRNLRVPIREGQAGSDVISSHPSEHRYSMLLVWVALSSGQGTPRDSWSGA